MLGDKNTLLACTEYITTKMHYLKKREKKNSINMKVALFKVTIKKHLCVLVLFGNKMTYET